MDTSRICHNWLAAFPKLDSSLTKDTHFGLSHSGRELLLLTAFSTSKITASTMDKTVTANNFKILEKKLATSRKIQNVTDFASSFPPPNAAKGQSSQRSFETTAATQ